MYDRIWGWMLGLLLGTAFAAPAWAQSTVQSWPPDPPPAQSKPAPKAKAKAKRPPLDDVEELTPGQIKRAQERESGGRDPGARNARGQDAPQAVKRAQKSSAPQGRQINCTGPFAKDSSHVRLAQFFGTQNVVFTEVDGPGNTKLMASVLFPKEPARRVEILWLNNANRTGLQVIAVNGKSGWSAPLGVRLGMQIAAIEKLNKRPFALTAFGADGSTVADWEGGALASMPNGCKLGVRVAMDPRASEEARSRVAAMKTGLRSTDADLRAARPSIVEILLGY